MERVEAQDGDAKFYDHGGGEGFYSVVYQLDNTFPYNSHV